MCAVANDVGRPDLIYSFLSMASHHAAWTTRRCCYVVVCGCVGFP
ncbi:unnamed protein product [Ectocarpus sp. 12 AP-2014]